MVFKHLKLSDEIKQTMRLKFDEVYRTSEDQTKRDFRFEVLTGEIGHMSTSIVYEKVFGKDSPELKRAYGKAELKRAVADTFIQALMFADNEHIGFDELLFLGLGGLDEYLERKRKSK